MCAIKYKIILVNTGGIGSAGEERKRSDSHRLLNLIRDGG